MGKHKRKHKPHNKQSKPRRDGGRCGQRCPDCGKQTLYDSRELNGFVCSNTQCYAWFDYGWDGKDNNAVPAIASSDFPVLGEMVKVS